MAVGRFSTPLTGEGVIAMRDAVRDTTRRVEVPPGGGTQALLVSGLAVRVFTDLRCVVDGVEDTCSLISGT